MTPSETPSPESGVDLETGPRKRAADDGRRGGTATPRSRKEAQESDLRNGGVCPGDWDSTGPPRFTGVVGPSPGGGSSTTNKE